jgi:hypothetical protein
VTDIAAAYPMLAALDGPGPLHDMDDAQLASLAAEMRQAIIDTVSRTGGHLGSSLGTIELIDITRGVPGVFHAALTNVQLDEWRLGPDVPVPDGGCILLKSAVINRPY